MSRKFIVFSSISAALILGVSIFGSTNAKWGVNDSADPFGLQISIMGETHTVNFYSEYSNGSWNNPSQIEIIKGRTLTAPTPSTINGYTFKGWKNIVPSLSDVAISYDSTQINNLAINNDMSFYAIYESNNDSVYVNSNYYLVDADVTLSTSSIGATQIGKRYIGVDGIPNPVASWNDTRNIFTASGVYKFTNSNGAAMIYRKVGITVNSSWGASWDGNPGIGIYAWSDSSNVSIHMGYAGSGDTVYAYIPADFYNFKFSRYSHNNTNFTWGNESGNLCFDSSWHWSGDGNNHYSSTTIKLKMNNWSSWVDNWGSNNAKWE